MFIFIPKEKTSAYTIQEVWKNKNSFLNKQITVRGTIDYDDSGIKCTTGIPPSCGVNLGIKINDNDLLRIKNAPGGINIGCKGSKPICYPLEKKDYILKGTLKKVYSSYYLEVNSFQKFTGCNWDPGSCKNMCSSKNYYFDNDSKECKKYVEAGVTKGCCTVPPFKTLEECNSACK